MRGNALSYIEGLGYKRLYLPSLREVLVSNLQFPKKYALGDNCITFHVLKETQLRSTVD